MEQEPRVHIEYPDCAICGEGTNIASLGCPQSMIEQYLAEVRCDDCEKAERIAERVATILAKKAAAKAE